MGVFSERVAPASPLARLSPLYLCGEEMAGSSPAISMYRNTYLRDDLWNWNAMDICEPHVAPVVAIGQLRVVHSQ